MKVGDLVRHSTSDAPYVVVEVVGDRGARVRELDGKRTKLLSRSVVGGREIWLDDRWQGYKRI